MYKMDIMFQYLKCILFNKQNMRKPNLHTQMRVNKKKMKCFIRNHQLHSIEYKRNR